MIKTLGSIVVESGPVRVVGYSRSKTTHCLVGFE